MCVTNVLGRSCSCALQYMIKFCGKDNAGIYVKGSNGGIDMYERLACVKAGNYMAIITVCSYTADVTQDVLDLFKAV